MDTQEQNKLIAEFMGLTQDETMGFDDTPRKAWFESGIKKYDGSDIPYHRSWNWLIPVHRKISEIGLWMIANGHERLWLEKSKEIDNEILLSQTPEKAALLISHIIQWYNQNKSE